MNEIFTAGLFLGLFDVLGGGDAAIESGGLGEATERLEDPFDCCDPYDEGFSSSWEEGACWDW